MKKLTSLFVYLGLIITPSNLNAQILGGCGFLDVEEFDSKSQNCTNSSSTWLNDYRTPQHWVSNNAVPLKTISVNWIICQKNDGSNAWQDVTLLHEQVSQMFDSINRIYSQIKPKGYNLTCEPTIDYVTDSRIRFELNEIIFIKNDLFNNSTNASTMLPWLHANYPDTKNHLNHFFTMPTAGVSYWGMYAITNSTPYIITYGSMFSDWYVMWNDHINHIVHEYGHALGLHHPYEIEHNFGEMKDMSHFDFLDDVFGLCSESSCCLMFPTPTGYACPLTGSCFWNSQPKPHPLMNGGVDQRYISPKQTGRMHRALSLYDNSFVVNNKNMHKFVKEIIPYILPLEITQNETWDFKIKMYQDIVIKQGNTLTVKCEVMMPNSGKIIVEPGAKLIIDGGKITNYYYLDPSKIGLWQGIEVWGTTNKHQSPASQPTFQGKLEIINGGTIENAINGVRNWKPGDYNKIGGVIVADNGVFLNNSHSVEFVIYENFLPTNPSVKLNNISKFTNTDFIINNNYLGNKSIFDSHVTLWGVYGISFVNCHFSNDITLKSYTANKNRAIYSVDAGYTVSAGCGIIVPYPNPCPNANLLKSTFTGFNRAIEASGTATTKTMVIDQAVFTNNLFGVYINDFDNYTISRSSFNLGYAGYTNYFSACYGVYTQYSSGYKIEENEFSRLAAVTNSYGLRIIESGPENNRSYKNKFFGLTHGQYITGINRNSSDALKGYQFICNEFNGNSRGVHVGTATSSNGIRLYQGEYSPLKSAGNVFLNTPSGSYTIYNASTWPISYYHNNGNTIPTFNTANVTLGYTSNSNTCLSSFGGIVGFSAKLTNLKSELSNLTQIKDDLEYNLMNLLDDGNTDDFKDKINLQWNSDAWELRNKLIEKSPYITRESILEAIGQHILPNAMILEICLANPDATKGESFIDDLNSINYIPLPEYMINYIRNNWDEKTVRTTLEAEIASLTASSDFIKDEILRLKLSQEEIYYDSISLVISNLSGTKKELKLIELAIEKEDWSTALSILQLALDNENFRNEWDRFAQYEDYILFRSGLNDRKFSQLNESEIDHLITLAAGIGKVSEYAKNILCFFYDICIENIDLEGGKSIDVQQNDVDLALLNDIFYQIEIYPNPAENFTSLKWDITNQLTNCEFRLYDLEGNLILNKPIEKNVGEMLIDTRTLINGVYLCTIENQGVIKSSKKLIIQKVN